MWHAIALTPGFALKSRVILASVANTFSVTTGPQMASPGAGGGVTAIGGCGWGGGVTAVCVGGLDGTRSTVCPPDGCTGGGGFDGGASVVAWPNGTIRGTTGIPPRR